jgi:hypothetical protein
MVCFNSWLLTSKYVALGTIDFRYSDGALFIEGRALHEYNGGTI